MERDFTLQALGKLYEAYLETGFIPVSFEEYMDKKPVGKTVVLRHDVDKRPYYALRVAEMQQALGVRGTYYFRIVRESFEPRVIEAILKLGHEIGYHYEDVALCHGNLDRAAEHFERTLDRFRLFYPVRTICMHGSPLSRWDNRILWKKIDYRSFGITGEPYFDVDFSSGLYITDTGRRWDGDRFSIRDRMELGGTRRYKSTFDIIDGLRNGQFPGFVMQNFHPQRWTDDWGPWIGEWIMQRARNVAKRALRISGMRKA